jgi:methylmalonyl-CoA/ethylmalonyl-CoA epimerase
MNMSESFALSHIGQISVRAHDIERAVAFYRDTLGMTYLFTAGDRLAFFDCDGVRLMLDRIDPGEFDHPSSIIYFEVDDINRSHGALVERGVQMVSPEPQIVHKDETMDLWMTFFRDSEDNVLALMSEVERS